MAISRYEQLSIIKDEISNEKRIATFPFIKAEDIRDDANDIIIRFDTTMRFDKLANDYLGDGRYWWAICLLNDIHLPFSNSVIPGTLLRIPTSISPIINKIKEKMGKK